MIWGSILGAAPFSLLMPHVGFAWTIVLSFCVGLVLSSAFPAILLYAQELLPYKLGLISGLFLWICFRCGGYSLGRIRKYGGSLWNRGCLQRMWLHASFRTGYLVPSQLEKEVKTILPFSLLLLQLNVNY